MQEPTHPRNGPVEFHPIYRYGEDNYGGVREAEKRRQHLMAQLSEGELAVFISVKLGTSPRIERGAFSIPARRPGLPGLW